MSRGSDSAGKGEASNFLKGLDYSALQQCMHCGMCLPTCPTYVATGREKNSPRGRIALMRAVADNEIEATRAFAEEMYFCLGCLACTTACPAGVDYAQLIEMARAEAERKGVLDNPKRRWIRRLTMKGLFRNPRLLRAVGKLLFFYQASGLQKGVRYSGILRIFPWRLAELEKMTPVVRRRFSDRLIKEVEAPLKRRFRVGVLTGCVQDLAFSDVNRDTVDVLLINGCEVVTPRNQPCCGSLHGHNGEWNQAVALAKRNIALFDLDSLDAIITNAAGCGSHLKHYDRLLAGDPAWAERARAWSQKVKDISEWLVEIGFCPPPPLPTPVRVTYHEACHLCHGQKVTKQPREILRSIQGLELCELEESTWCCGSAGVYSLTQPEMAGVLLTRKMENIRATGASVVASANPGCTVQISSAVGSGKDSLRVLHPVSLLAAAYRGGGAGEIP